MAEPTKTRVQLRHEICKDLRMPWFRRFGSSRDVTAAGADYIEDTALEMPNDVFSGQWVFITTQDENRLIVDHLGEQSRIIAEYDFDTQPDTDDDYEILQTWNATEIHDAINRAIREGFPAFFDIEEDTSLIVQEDKLEYDLSGLSTTIWRPLKLWIERTTTGVSGTVDSSTSTTITDSSLIGQLGDVDSDWRLSIYKGTGTGENFAVSSVNDSTGQVTINGTWTNDPDTTSKYKLYNSSDEEYPWYRVEAARWDPIEWPDTLRFYQNWPSFHGMRIRIQFMAEPQELSAEGDTTVIPVEYIIEKSKSLLYGQMVDDSRYNRQRYASLEEYHRQQAEMYKVQRAFEWPDGTRWNTHQTSAEPWGGGDVDPLGWS